MTIHDMLEMERTEIVVLRDVIDAIDHAVVIVASDMSILFANAAAEDRLRDQAVVEQRTGKLVARYPYAQSALVRSVALGAQDEAAVGASGIDVPLGSSANPAVAHVLPLQKRMHRERFESRAAAAVFIASAGTVLQSAIDAVAALFGLTGAERKVVGYVSEGLSRAEISEAQGVSDGTVKSQLAAIYDKTNTHDQRALQQLVREITPAVRRR